MRGARAILAAACVVACGRTGSEGGAAFQPLAIGAAVPAYAAATLTGDTVRVGGNEEPTVLNVWATWCVACQEEMAALDSLSREFKSRGVRVIGVSVDEFDDTGKIVTETAYWDVARFLRQSGALPEAATTGATS